VIDPNLSEKILALVKARAPSADAIVSVHEGRTAGTRFACNEMTTAVDSDDGSIELTIALENRHASASTNRTDDASLEALADRAVHMAKLAPADPEWMPVLGAQPISRVPDAWDNRTAALDGGPRASFVSSAIEQAEINKAIAAGFYTSTYRRELRVSSTGFRAEHAWTSATFTMTARTPDGSGSGWAGGEETSATMLRAEIASTAIHRCLRSQQPRSLPAGKYTVILEPDAVGDLLSFLIDALDARSADEGRSFFSKSRGKLFAENVTLVSNPTDPRTAARPYDGDGLPLAPTTWIDHGVLRALRYSRYWAAKQKQKPTGHHGSYQLLGGTADDTDALVKQVDKGLLVTRFWYTRWLDPRTLLVTGLTRDGVFWIEKGAISHPVNNFRFNESPAKMLASCSALTRMPVRVPSYYEVLRVPALIAHDFEMASVSAAV